MNKSINERRWIRGTGNYNGGKKCWFLLSNVSDPAFEKNIWTMSCKIGSRACLLQLQSMPDHRISKSGGWATAKRAICMRLSKICLISQCTSSRWPFSSDRPMENFIHEFMKYGIKSSVSSLKWRINCFLPIRNVQLEFHCCNWSSIYLWPAPKLRCSRLSHFSHTVQLMPLWGLGSYTTDKSFPSGIKL